MKITLLTGQTSNFKDFFGFDIKIIKSSLAKKLTLRIDEKNHQPVLTIPKLCSQKRAFAFLEANHDWIINMLAKLPQATSFINGETLPFFGQTYTILHNPSQRGTYFEENFIKVGGNPEFLHRRITDFLKQQALKKLSDLALKKAKTLNCRISNIAIKDTKSRWGSCSSLGNINFNWRICMAPIPVIEYLVCHEVVHLKHQNHSPLFWQTLEQLCPDYKNHRNWLKVRGKELYKYI